MASEHASASDFFFLTDLLTYMNQSQLLTNSTRIAVYYTLEVCVSCIPALKAGPCVSRPLVDHDIGLLKEEVSPQPKIPKRM